MSIKRTLVHRFRVVLGHLGWKTRSLEAWERWHDPVVKRSVEEVLSFVPEDGLFLDIGANVGLFSKHLHAARPRARGILFEPVTVYFERCRDRFKDAPGMRVEHLAIGDEDHTATIYKAAHNPGGNSLVDELMFDRRPNARVAPDMVVETEEVTVRHIGRWLEAEGIDHVDFIKSDTEGYDYAVLRGLLPWLERTGCRPVLLCELMLDSYHTRRVEQREALEALFRLGYAEVDPAKLDDVVVDVLLVPRDRAR